MQDRYAGDVGDFSKIMLVRHVLGREELPVSYGLPIHYRNDETDCPRRGHLERSLSFEGVLGKRVPSERSGDSGRKGSGRGGK